jgi:hypothetical protein
MKTKFFIGGAALALALSVVNPALATPPTGLTNLVGTWTNVNPTTGGIVKIVITSEPTGLKIQTFGACSPTPCDHGKISAAPFSKSVGSSFASGLSGEYDFGFSKMLVTAQRTTSFDGGTFLELETRTRFAPGDTRYDYMRTELFRK